MPHKPLEVGDRIYVYAALFGEPERSSITVTVQHVCRTVAELEQHPEWAITTSHRRRFERGKGLLVKSEVHDQWALLFPHQYQMAEEDEPPPETANIPSHALPTLINGVGID